jgi:polyisoprenoid-binding protein YceI
MKSRTRTVPLTVRVLIGPDTLRATTTFTVRQSDYGIRPYRGGPGGTVRVADAVTFDIDAVALRRP